jgi:hypothetical protein
MLLFAKNTLVAQQPKSSTSFTKFKQEIVIGNFSDLFKFDGGRVRSFFVTDTSLFVWNGDGVDNYFFSQYSLRNNSLVRKFVQGGRLRGQGLSILSAGMFGNQTIWYYDLALKKAVLIDLPRNNGANDSLAITEFMLPGKYYYSAQLLNRSTLLGSGSVDTGYTKIPSILQQIILATNHQTKTFGTMPDAPANTPFNSWRDANQGFLYLNPSHNKAVLAKHYTDEIEIFDLRSMKSIIVKGPENLMLEFRSVRLPNMDISGLNERTKVAFTIGVTTDKYIYLQYIGLLSTKNRGDKVNASNKIYVYDWAGIPVAKLILERDVIGFTVSKNNKVIYGFDPDSKNVIKAILPVIK